MNKKNLRKGFTTVELVIVIAVIAILATALIPTFGGLINSANETAAMNEARTIYNDLLLEYTESMANADCYIEVDGWYYAVNDGKLSTDGTDKEPSVGFIVTKSAANATEATDPTAAPYVTKEYTCSIKGNLAKTTDTTGTIYVHPFTGDAWKAS